MKAMCGKWVRIASLGAAAFTVAAGASASRAQTKPGATEQAPRTNVAPQTRTSAEPGAKIAAINLRAAIAGTAEGKQAAAQLEAQFAERRKELEDLNKKIGDLQQKLNASGSVLSDEEKNHITLEGQKLTRQLDRRQQDYQEDLTDAQNEVVSRIGRRIVEVLGKYAPNNGYSAVLDDSSQGTPVMYASTDITQEVVKLYDQTYPVKASAAPADAKPGAKASTAKPSGQ